MKKAKLKYSGYQNKNYCFKDPIDSKVFFSGARADLIYEFALRENAHVGEWFEVSYFSTFEGDVESKIISDLTIISKESTE